MKIFSLRTFDKLLKKQWILQESNLKKKYEPIECIALVTIANLFPSIETANKKKSWRKFGNFLSLNLTTANKQIQYLKNPVKFFR